MQTAAEWLPFSLLRDFAALARITNFGMGGQRVVKVKRERQPIDRRSPCSAKPCVR
jgi:hypothetical protein